MKETRAEDSSPERNTQGGGEATAYAAGVGAAAGAGAAGGFTSTGASPRGWDSFRQKEHFTFGCAGAGGTQNVNFFPQLGQTRSSR